MKILFPVSAILCAASLAAAPFLAQAQVAQPAARSSASMPPAPPAQQAPPSQQNAPAAQELSFGSHPLQRMDFYRSSAQGPRPLILFVHGGAWIGGDKSDSTGSAKIRHYTQSGYQLASVNYRLLPEVDIEHQADDVAAALAALLEQSRELNIDTRQIVLMGHSAGAHLAALVATDPRFLKRYGLMPGDIGGVVLLDGAAYDVPSQIVDAGPLLGFAYQIAFGSAQQRQLSLSPANHASGDNARDFLLLHVERPEAERQARRFANALQSSGTRVSVAQVPGRGMDGHNMINAMLGRSDSQATPIVDQWLAGLFAAPTY